MSILDDLKQQVKEEAGPLGAAKKALVSYIRSLRLQPGDKVRFYVFVYTWAELCQATKGVVSENGI